jgi:hypothetical protein
MATATKLAPASADAEHLKIIQSVISRLAQNSFQTKSWSVAIVTAMLAFTSRSAQASACALALFPAFCFWVLDAYYLRQERLFRALYDAALNGDTPSFCMSTNSYKTEVPSWDATMFALPVFLVHAIIFFVIGLVTVTFALT